MAGRVYYRSKVEPGAQAAYGPWHPLPENAALVVAATQLGDGTHVVTSVC